MSYPGDGSYPGDAEFPGTEATVEAGSSGGTTGDGGRLVGAASFVVFIGGKRVATTNLEFTLSDPGGCEMAQIALPAGTEVQVGARVRIYDGLTCLWSGIVDEPGQRWKAGAEVNVGCIGRKYDLGRRPFQMPYICQSLTEWRGMGMQRQRNLITGGYDPTRGNAHVSADENTQGDASLVQEMNSGVKPISEMYLDAGPGATWSAVHYAWAKGSLVGAGDANWVWGITTSNDDILTGGVGTGNLRAAGPASGVYVVPDKRFLATQFYYDTTVGVEGAYTLYWTKLLAVGKHGLTVHTDINGLQGIRASDLLIDAARRSQAGVRPDVDASPQVVIPHLFDRVPVTASSIIERIMAVLGWHWGVWPDRNNIEGQDLFVVRESAEQVAVNFRDLEAPDINEKYSDMPDQAIVTYSTIDGTSGSVTVDRKHPRLGAGRGTAITVDAGIVGSSTVAEAVGLYHLALKQAEARGAGSLTLPDDVILGTGSMPSHHVRPGLNRVRVIGLPIGVDNLIAGPPERVDTFRVSRLTCTVKDGRPTTTIEVDAGADLTEVLQARMDIAAARVEQF